MYITLSSVDTQSVKLYDRKIKKKHDVACKKRPFQMLGVQSERVSKSLVSYVLTIMLYEAYSVLQWARCIG